MSSLVRRIQKSIMGPRLKPRATISGGQRPDNPRLAKRKGAPRGSRRGKRSKAWLAFRAARRAA